MLSETFPSCEHGAWAFAGADFKRKRAKWRCPTGQCSRASKAAGLHPADPERDESDWATSTGAVVLSSASPDALKHEYGLAPRRLRGFERVAQAPSGRRPLELPRRRSVLLRGGELLDFEGYFTDGLLKPLAPCRELFYYSSRPRCRQKLLTLVRPDQLVNTLAQGLVQGLHAASLG